MQKTLKVLISSKDLTSNNHPYYMEEASKNKYSVMMSNILTETNTAHLIVEGNIAILDSVVHVTMFSNIYAHNYGETASTKETDYTEYRASAETPKDLLPLLLSKRLIVFCYLNNIETIKVGDSLFTYDINIHCV